MAYQKNLENYLISNFQGLPSRRVRLLFALCHSNGVRYKSNEITCCMIFRGSHFDALSLSIYKSSFGVLWWWHQNISGELLGHILESRKSLECEKVKISVKWKKYQDKIRIFMNAFLFVYKFDYNLSLGYTFNTHSIDKPWKLYFFVNWAATRGLWFSCYLHGIAPNASKA